MNGGKQRHIFSVIGLENDPERYRNMSNRVYYPEPCATCHQHIINTETGLCVLCEDRKILKARARRLLAGETPEHGMKWIDADYLINRPHLICTGAPCKSGHVGVRWKKNRRCVACNSEAARRQYRKRAGIPEGSEQAPYPRPTTQERALRAKRRRGPYKKKEADDIYDLLG